MIPHDPVNQRNEAMELWADKGIDPITFFDRLEFPNPRESAKNLFLWMSDPIQLFPDLFLSSNWQRLDESVKRDLRGRARSELMWGFSGQGEQYIGFQAQF